VTGIFPAVSKSALEAVKRLMSRAKALDMFVSFDPNLRPQLWPDEKEMVRTLNALAWRRTSCCPAFMRAKILTKRETAAEMRIVLPRPRRRQRDRQARRGRRVLVDGRRAAARCRRSR
jgi:sugar/nucleoside kinase (ribokinase family)